VQRKKRNREGMADAWARLVNGRNVGGSGGWAGVLGWEQAGRRKQEEKGQLLVGLLRHEKDYLQIKKE
jgi:hypothetical protein